MLLFVFTFAFLSVLSTPRTIPVDIRVRNVDQELRFIVYDHSHTESIRINISGDFHRFAAVQEAIDHIAKLHADWCGFALKLKSENIIQSWTTQQRAAFGKMMQDFSCSHRERQGMYGEERPQTENDVSSFEENSYVIVALSIVFSNLLILVVFLIVAYAKLYYCKTVTPKVVVNSEENVPVCDEDERILRSHSEDGSRIEVVADTGLL